MPKLGATFGIAVSAFLFHPHRARQYQIGRNAGNGRVGVRHHDEVFRIAITGIAFLHDVGAGLHIVIHHHPIAVELAILEHAVLQHCMVAGLVGNGTGRYAPDFFRMRTVLGIGDHHIGRQAMRKSTDLTCGTASRRLAGKRERAIARR
ncbi:hypothetical protein D3C81_1784420 [compost metagenome]